MTVDPLRWGFLAKEVAELDSDSKRLPTPVGVSPSSPSAKSWATLANTSPLRWEFLPSYDIELIAPAPSQTPPHFGGGVSI